MKPNRWHHSSKLIATINLTSMLVVLGMIAIAVNGSNARAMANSSRPVPLGAVSTVPEASRIDLASWKRVAKEPGIVLLDSRPRMVFAKGHVSGAINIPADELESRARHEIPLDSRVVIYCGYNAKCEKSYADIGVLTPCSDVTKLLHDHYGYADVKVLGVPEIELLAGGIAFDFYDYELRRVALN